MKWHPFLDYFLDQSEMKLLNGTWNLRTRWSNVMVLLKKNTGLNINWKFKVLKPQLFCVFLVSKKDSNILISFRVEVFGDGANKCPFKESPIESFKDFLSESRHLVEELRNSPLGRRLGCSFVSTNTWDGNYSFLLIS